MPNVYKVQLVEPRQPTTYEPFVIDGVADGN